MLLSKSGFAATGAPDVRVLFVTPRADDAAAMKTILSHTKWQLRVVTTCADALRWMKRESFPVVICEERLTDGSWKSLLHSLDGLPESPRLIVCSALSDTSLYAEVLNLGGYDLLSTPFDTQEVVANISLAWQSWHSERQKSLHEKSQAPALMAASAAAAD